MRSSPKSWSLLVLVLVLFPLLTACEDPGAIAYVEGSDVNWVGLEEVPPGNVNTNVITFATVGAKWDTAMVTMSPNGQKVAVGFIDFENSSDSTRDHEVHVYSPLSQPQDRLIAEWDDGDLKDLIEANTDLSYPDRLKDFNPFELHWMDNQRLLFYVQPLTAHTGIESIPQNVAFVINPTSGTVTDGPAFYDRTATPPLSAPDHPEKTTYSSENQSGTVLIEGSPVTGLSTSVEDFDFVYLGG